MAPYEAAARLGIVIQGVEDLQLSIAAATSHFFAFFLVKRTPKWLLGQPFIL
ncbi:uncharacterized protein LY89DRAFT_692635 [Mollisia scopiformis]|uniref:Uncharacterized protein n=1 Tax=Mollisia scopiformis TaxID=149040 RepID=A0A132B1E3_MOLSC|nr:uncharacterized protein LY89DRAFT_692635 [Mollisia scopiformis]KUJ06198.1 hypothetical protein LY89DRAFT_692635 [Mollisia scopiformis]